MSHIVIDFASSEGQDHPPKSTPYAMTILKNVRWYLLDFAVAGLIFYFAGTFSLQQSIVLALGVTWGLFVLGTKAPQPNLSLEPYYVQIYPQWYEILTAFQLLATAAEYDTLWEAFSSLPQEEYNVFRNGIWFTVLNDRAVGTATLIYSNDRHDFMSEVDFRRGLAPLTLSRESDKPSLRDYTPELFVRRGDLGLVVPDWWWKQKAEVLAGKAQAQEVFDTGTVELTIATLEFTEFTVYWKGDQPNSKREAHFEKLRSDDRAKFGWTAEAHRERNWPEILKHRYFEVRHNRL